ncbi:MAG: DUF4114 domain-containing protein [Verrucomicrobiota bacterium]
MKTTIKLAITAILALSISTPHARSDDGTDSSKTQSENSVTVSKSESSDVKSQEGESASKVAVDNTPNISPVQSAARPFNLDIAGPVYLAGSDARSAAFQANELPAMINTVNQNMGEFKPLDNIASKALDPSKLVLSTDAQVRVYFVGEGAGFHNTLGINLEGTGIRSGDPKLIFPDASSQQSSYKFGEDQGGSVRTSNAPLMSGDFVDFGTMKAGQKLDFFLIADGANGANKLHVWTASPSVNSDGIQHMASFGVKDSSYLLLSFEDLSGGGDRDFNDIVFAVQIGAANVAALANPEPRSVLTFLLLGATVYVVRRRMGGSPVAVPA